MMEDMASDECKRRPPARSLRDAEQQGWEWRTWRVWCALARTLARIPSAACLLLQMSEELVQFGPDALAHARVHHCRQG